MPFERSGTVSLISSLVAHELRRQTLDADAIGMRIDENDPLPEEPPGEMAALSYIH